MAVRKGDQDQGKLKVIDASKNLLRYTYERVKSKTFPKAERWLMPKSIWDQVKTGKQRRRLKKILQKEENGEYASGTAYNSLTAWRANAARGNAYHQEQRMKNYYYTTKAGIKNGNYERAASEG